MATLRQAFPSKYLKAADLGGIDTQAVVKQAFEETVQAPGGAPEKKIVLHFHGGMKSFILNSTNFRAMVKITGQEDSDNWKDVKVLLVSERTAFGGETYDAIRIHPIPAALPQTVQSLNALLEGTDVPSENPF